MMNKDEIFNLLEAQNPWWQEPGFLPPEDKMPKREAFLSLWEDLISLRQIIGLTGLRRTGKSTIVKQAIARLLSEGTEPRKILYFSFDEPAVLENKEILSGIIESYLKETAKRKAHNLNDKHFLFFDEIQLVPYWQGIIKRYYDMSPMLKFVVTGSSSLWIRQEARESLAGRIFENELGPLSFSEYSRLCPNGVFEDYLDFGGFPELLSIENTAKKIEYLKQWVIGKILEVDIPKIAGVRHIADFERLFWSLLPNAGQVINFQNLAVDLGIKRPTLFKYLRLLKDSLLTTEVTNLAGSFRSLSRVRRKIYPASPNFLSLISQAVPVGAKAESYVAQYLRKKKENFGVFYLRGKEIDFVLPEKKLAIEVKYQNKIHPEDYRFLCSYAEQKGYRPLLLTKDLDGVLGQNKVRAIPLCRIEKEI